MSKQKAIEMLKALLVNHKEIHVHWLDFLLAHPDQEENYIGNAGGIKHHRKYIRKYDEALEALTALEQQPEPAEVSKSYGRVLDAVVAAFATTDDEIIQQNVQAAVDQGRKVCSELDRQAEELAKAEMLIAFYLEGLEKSETEITQLKKENKRLRDGLKDVVKFTPNDTDFDRKPTRDECLAEIKSFASQVLQERKAKDGEEKTDSQTAGQTISAQ